MLNFYTITIGGQEYKCKLTTASIIQCEEKLGGNMIDIFFKMRTGKLPTVKEMVTVLHYSLQAYNHGIKLEDSYNLFDAWLEEHHVMEFMNDLVGIYKASGIINPSNEEEETEEADEKN